MIQLNNWSVGAVPTLHIETNRVIVIFMWKAELKKAILVQRGEYSLVFEDSIRQLVKNLMTTIRKQH